MGYMKAEMSINNAITKCKEEKIQRQKEEVEWLNTLLDYAEGKKKWDSGKEYVCEDHPRRPSEQNLLINCRCGALGMAPKTPEDCIGEKKIIKKMLKMSAESLPPIEFSQLEAIIQILRNNRQALKQYQLEDFETNELLGLPKENP